MSKLLRPALFILVFLLVWSFFAKSKTPESTDNVILETDNKIAIGQVVILEVFNNSKQVIKFGSQCPKNPLSVERYVDGEWIAKEATAKTNVIKCENATISIQPRETHEINYGPWNHELFNEEAKYKLNLAIDLDGEEKIYTTEIEVVDRSIFRVIWEEAFYKPIFNSLIFLVSIIPGHHLGWAVILLTILIKILLLAPNHKALKAQKQMQKVQPQLDALKKKYEKDPQRLAQETMEIWKKHKVNPTSSCLPLLIQFPILIALFYVVKDGMAFTNPQLLYSGLQGFDTQLTNTFFLGMDLTKINFIVLPLIIGLLQFLQMKLSLPAISGDVDKSSPLPMMNKTMLYFMPVMIAFFTASVPAAVALYWGTSTLFGIGQQLIVNRMKT